LAAIDLSEIKAFVGDRDPQSQHVLQVFDQMLSQLSTHLFEKYVEFRMNWVYHNCENNIDVRDVGDEGDQVKQSKKTLKIRFYEFEIMS
jgi:hypothetical protein